MFDLIGAMTSEAGVRPEEARAVAARFLRHVSRRLASRYGGQIAQAFETRLPHWSEWQGSEPYLAPVDRPPAEAALGTDAQLNEILGQLGIDPVRAGLALPAIVTYLRIQLPPELLRQVYAVAPMLMTAAPEHGSANPSGF